MYTATRNAYQDMMVSMKSLLHHTKVDRVYCLTEDDELPFEVPDFVKVINITKETCLHPKGVNMENQYSYIVLYRPLVFRFVDDDKVLSLDCDTIVRKDVSPLFDVDMSNYFYAAVPEDHTNMRTIWPYFNFGVTILNLKKMKERERILIDLLNESKHGCCEQDCMMLTYRDAIFPMKNIFNASYCTGEYDEKDVVIRHYVGHTKKEIMYRSDEYRKYLYMPWDQVLERQVTGNDDSDGKG